MDVMISFFPTYGRPRQEHKTKTKGFTPLETTASKRNSSHSFSPRHREFLTGFTIIELLIVAGIVALLSSMILVRVQGWREKVRDVSREQEMKELQKALALYVATWRVFPTGTNVILTGTDSVSTVLVNGGLIRTVLPDPLSTGVYVFTYNSPTGLIYTITYTLETNTIPGKPAGPHTVTP